MKALFRSIGAGVMVWTAWVTPAHAQSAAGWKALHYAAQNNWSCSGIQPYPGFEDGYIRPQLELHFDHKGEEQNLTGSFTESFRQYGPNGTVSSADYNFAAHVFDSPQEGTGIYLEQGHLARINRDLDRPFAWLLRQSWIRFQIVPGDNGAPYRITGVDADGANYTCSAVTAASANQVAAISLAEAKLTELHKTFDSVLEELGAARFYYQQGNMREQTCEAARSAQTELERAGNQMREISRMMSGGAYNDADRANWARQLGSLQESLRDGNNAAMNYWSASC